MEKAVDRLYTDERYGLITWSIANDEKKQKKNERI
jgi:hypothetical protein